MRTVLFFLLSLLTGYINPSIGTGNHGNVFVGPCVPFGMVKPSPDVKGCNPGWGPLTEEIYGFSQLHVSGTGGSPKYGNILIMPFSEGEMDEEHNALREKETIALGMYATTLKGSGISVEITASDRAALYRISYPEGAGLRGLEVDAGVCLKRKNGKGQRLLDGQVSILSANEVCGYSTAEGGWGGGKAYTVYFDIRSDAAITAHNSLERQENLIFAEGTKMVTLKVGVSFVSVEQARKNADEGLCDGDFNAVRYKLCDDWEKLLSHIRIPEDTSPEYKRMFYTALYHSMLMPSCRTGEWAKASDDETYYDDYFTLWDIYRTSLPLITLIDPDRVRDIVNSLLTIYRHDGYMPDGRSGNSNGATQGSSNAEIVIADAWVKGIDGIDYEEALEAMLKDARVAPPDGRYEGREGIEDYIRLGYIPWGTKAAGSRTVDGAYCDYAIAVLAKGLGHEDTAREFLQRSHNWANLWCDFEEDGIKGFIMPKDKEGNWLKMSPNTSFQHWDGFFYEANCYETSLCAPHDMDSLIARCGGREAFLARLQKAFRDGCIDLGNEPSFLTSSLFHWAGRPDLTYDTVSQVIRDNYNGSADGLPGNDDSGAMSSWLAFHMMGLYPVAGTERYLVHSPLLKEVSIDVPDRKEFKIRTRRLSGKRHHIRSAKLNGKSYPYSTIRHSDIISGGELVLKMGRRPGKWGREMTEND